MQINRSIPLYLCLLLIGSLEAQVPQAPLPIASSAASNAPTTQAPAYQLTVKVRRVALDVVVTDAKGKPVEGLKQDDFKVIEDGVVQPIHFFDLHKTTAVGSRPAIDLHLPPNTFSNLSTAPADQPVTILLFDMLNTPQGAFPAAHQALVKFIKEQKSSTRVAIFVLTDRLHMVQGFTDDETRLLAALDSKAIKAPISRLRVADSSAGDSASLLGADPGASAAAGPGAQTAISEDQARPGGADTPLGAGAVLEMLSNAETEENAYQLNQRVETTVNAFTNMARFVSAQPGRKNLIWMSGSFPSELLPDSPQNSGGRSEFSAVYLQEDIREAQQVLKDSRVAIYPVDIRGLQADSQFSAAGKYSSGPPKISNIGIQQGAEHATMDALADDTGGRAFYNTNSLQQAMDTAVREGSEYYSLTYAPSNPKEDGAVRHIKVVLTNANYHLYYRREYLANDTSHPAPVQPLVLDMNMQHGAPNSSELFFEAKVNPIGGVMVASSDEVESLKRFLQTKATGKRTKIATGPENVQHYDINFAVIGRQLQMPPTESGQYATDMSFGLAAYTQNSELLNGMEVSIKNSIPAAQFQKIESQGYHASMVFVVPVEAVSIRLAVRDEIGNRIGTMEIPLPIPLPKNTTAAAKATK